MTLRLRGSPRSSPLAAVAGLAAAVIVAACAPTGPPAAPSATPDGQASPPCPTSTPAAASTAAPSPTSPTPLPSGVLPLPDDFAVELAPGRYSSSPPFELLFTFEVLEAGWRAGHLNAEFFDIQRFDGVPTTGPPSRILAFANPDTIQGTTSIPATDLTPEAAVAALTARDDLVTANVAELELLGCESVRVDVHAPVDNTAVFAGEDGTYRQSADLDARLVAVSIDDGLLLVLVVAKPDDLDAAWDQARAILRTVDLD